MGKRKQLNDCTFTINLADQPKQKYDYQGFLSWLVEDPRRLQAVAPDWTSKSSGVRNILQGRELGALQPALPPSAPPELPPSTTPEETEETDLLGLSDAFDAFLDKNYDQPVTTEGAASTTKPPRKPRKSRQQKTTSKKTKSSEKLTEAKNKLAEASRKSQQGFKNVGRLGNLLLKSVTPDSKTNSMLGVGWDDAIYEELKTTLNEILVNFKEAAEDTKQALQFVLEALKDQLTREQMQALKPYFLKYFNEFEQTKTLPVSANIQNNVLEAASVQELLDKKVAAYAEIGEINGSFGVYVVYQPTNPAAGATKRVFVRPIGRDLGEATTYARDVIRQLQQGKGPLIKNIPPLALSLRDKLLGVSTTPRTVTDFSENTAIGEQALMMGTKHALVKLKDLFSVDSAYAMNLADGATNSPRAPLVQEYLRSRPEYLAETTARLSELKEIRNQIARLVKEKSIVTALKELDIRVTDANSYIVLDRSGTYEHQDYIKSIGAEWDGELKRWFVAGANIKSFLDSIRDRKATDRKNAGGKDATDGTNIRNPKLLDLRRRYDAIPDRSRPERSIDELVSKDTQSLLQQGAQMGIPAKVIEEQIEDVAKVTQQWNKAMATPNGKGVFLLASDPGSGKTFVLGAALKEIVDRSRKANMPKIRIVYVTMNTQLISQVKQDLKEYGIEANVEFVTYAGLRDGKLGDGKPNNPYQKTDVLVFDEAHNIKNLRTSDVAKIAQDLIAKTRMSILASATPYENPTQMRYLEPTGIFEPFGGYAYFAGAYGAQVQFTPKGDINANSVIWVRDNVGYSDFNAAAAREYINKLGIYSQRNIQLPIELVDMRLTPTSGNPEMVLLYESLVLAMASPDRQQALNPFGKAYIKNYLKRVLEASKVDAAIREAKDAIKRGRYPIIFTETKAERIIDIFDWLQQEERYAADRLLYPEDRPLRSDYGLPPQGVTEIFAIAANTVGVHIITLPAIEEQIAAEFDPSQIAVYNGSVGDAQAKQNLTAWRLGTKPLLLATMAKGGTGLSLHDKVGNHPTTMIVLNLPWSGTQVKQVAQRNARYGLKSKAEIIWLFATDIDMDRELGRRVGGRINDISNTVTGEGSETGRRLQSWDLDELDIGDLINVVRKSKGVLETISGEMMNLKDFEPTNMIEAMLLAATRAEESGTGMLDKNTLSVGLLRSVLEEAHDLTPESAEEVILYFAGEDNEELKASGEALILVPYGRPDTQLTNQEKRNSLVDSQGRRFAGVEMRMPDSPDSVSTEEPVDAKDLTRGITSDIVLADGGAYPAHYELRELTDLVPSHDAFTFTKRPDYQYVNDRDYDGNPANRTAVIAQAQNYNPSLTVSNAATSVEGPPMVLPSGQTLGGNSRVMALYRVYDSNTKGRDQYKQLLHDRAGQFGFTSEQVASFKQPVLVRVIDNLGEDTVQKAITRLNFDPQKALSDVEQSIARGKSLTPEFINILNARIGQEETLAAALAAHGVEIINVMIESGMVPEIERAKWLDIKAGKVTDFAKQQITDMLVGSLFESTAQMSNTPAAIMQQLERIAPQVLRLHNTNWDLIPYFPGSIRFATEGQKKRIKLSELAREQVLDPATGKPGPKYSLVEASIGQAISTNNAKAVIALFRDYVDQAMVEITGQGGLFAVAMSKEEAFNQFFPTPTGERVPQFVLDAQNRLDGYFKGGGSGTLSASAFGLDAFARLGDVIIVAGYKLYKAGMSLLQWQNSVARYLGITVPNLESFFTRIRDAIITIGGLADGKYYTPDLVGEEEFTTATPDIELSARTLSRMMAGLGAIGILGGIAYSDPNIQALFSPVVSELPLYGKVYHPAPIAAELTELLHQLPGYAMLAGIGYMVWHQISSSRGMIDTEADIETDLLYEALDRDYNPVVESYLAAGMPVNALSDLFEMRRVRTAIREGYEAGRYDDDDLEILQVDKYGEDLFIPKSNKDAISTAYPEMDMVEARMTVGGRWRIAHRTTGDNLIPGESFSSVAAARAAYAVLLAEFKRDQQQGETEPRVIRAENAIRDFAENGTPLPDKLPVTLNKFQRRAKALYEKGEISRSGYSKLLKEINQRTYDASLTYEAIASPRSLDPTQSNAPNFVKKAADRILDSIRTGRQKTIVETTRKSVIDELKWRLINAPNTMNLNQRQQGVLRDALVGWTLNTLPEPFNRPSVTSAKQRRKVWETISGIDPSARKYTPQELGLLLSTAQTLQLTDEERTRVEKSIADIKASMSRRQIETAEAYAAKQGTPVSSWMQAAVQRSPEDLPGITQRFLEVDISNSTARIVMDATTRLQKSSSAAPESVKRIVNAGMDLYRQGLAKAVWVKEMLKQFGESMRGLILKAWNAITQAAQAAFAKTDPTLGNLLKALNRSTTPQRTQQLQKEIDKQVLLLAQNQNRIEQAKTIVNFTANNLMKLTGLNYDQAQTILELYANMGIDIGRLRIQATAGRSEEKALVEFSKDGTALITAYEKADISSFIHEAAHIYRRWLLNETNGHTATEIQALQRWAGVGKDGVWTEAAEEKFALAFERYIRNNKPPLQRLESLFARMATWMRQIYQVLKGSPINLRLPANTIATFDKIFTESGKKTIPTSGPERLNQFIGNRSQNPARPLYSQAKVLEFAYVLPGMTLEEKEVQWARIANMTGWHRVIETEPFMFEIDSSLATLRDPDFMTRLFSADELNTIPDPPDSTTIYLAPVIRRQVELGSIIDHPQLFAAYPELYAVPLRIAFQKHRASMVETAKTLDLYKGYFDGEIGRNAHIEIEGPFADTTGKLYNPELFVNVLLHEIQHLIQRREDFSGGSNDTRALNDELIIGSEKQRTREQELRQQFPDWFAKYDSIETTLLEYLNNDIASEEDYDRAVTQLKQLHRSAPEEIRLYFRYRELPAYDIYLAATGEAMARLVQARQNFTPEQRKALPPREHLKQMLEEEGLMPRWSNMPEHALVFGHRRGRSQNIPKGYTDTPLTRMLNARLARATDPAERKRLQAQIQQLQTKPSEASTSTTAKTSTAGKPKFKLSDYDNITVAEVVDKLVNSKTTGRPITIKDQAGPVTITQWEQNFLDLAGLPRAVMASADVSAPLRQGAILTLPPQQWGRAARAFKDMMQSLVGQEYYQDFKQGLIGHKLFTTAQAAGLYIASEQVGENVITGGEETFISRMAKELPLFGPLVKSSERAYMAYLDSLRMSTFAKYVYQIERQGGTQQERRKAIVAAAKWINIATGRGTFEGRLQVFERAMPLLSSVFFAPRYVQSRLQLLSPRTYLQQPAVVRQQAWSDLLGFAATIATISAMAMFAGADIEWNPEDEDFLKIRFGNLRYDFLAGTQQVVRLLFLLSQAWGGAFVDSLEEMVTGIKQKRPGSRTGGDILLRFLRSKLAPIPSFFVDMQSRKDFIGRPFELDQAIIDRVVPMYWRESTEAYLRAGWTGALQQTPAAFGVGVSDYEKVSGIFSLADTPFTQELARKSIEIGRLRPTENEDKAAFKARATRTQKQLDTFGTQLVQSPQYARLTEEGKSTALRILRARIGRNVQESDLQPQIIVYSAIMADIERLTAPQK